MEKHCEICITVSSVVYCAADAARLCLSCDSKVHSANLLSSRHARTLVCESCKRRPVYTRCYDHQMFMCRDCDQYEHDVSPHHRKGVISSYMGCPSAKDLAALWGFDLDGSVPIIGSTSSGFGTSHLAQESIMASSNRESEAEKGENTACILQQLLDLKKLQLVVDCETSSLTSHRRQSVIFSSKSNTLKLKGTVNQSLQKSCGSDDNTGRAHRDQNQESYTLPFSQSEQLISSSTNGSPLQEDSSWACTLPLQGGQLWSQNMQDLGLCEDVACLDDLNIPDVDLTFRNFEELFRGEQEPTSNLLDYKEIACSSIGNDSLLETSDESCNGNSGLLINDPEQVL